MTSFQVLTQLNKIEQHGREAVCRILSRPEQWSGEHVDIKWQDFVNMDFYYMIQLTYSNLLLVETMEKLRDVR